MNKESQIIARRTLSDGKHVLLWDDGLVTFALGFRIRGIGAAQNEWSKEANIAAGWAFMGEACLFDSKEAPRAIKAIRQAFQNPYLGRPGFRDGEAPAYYRDCMVAAIEVAS